MRRALVKRLFEICAGVMIDQESFMLYQIKVYKNIRSIMNGPYKGNSLKINNYKIVLNQGIHLLLLLLGKTKSVIFILLRCAN